ncbi:MAG: hypothetical protein JKX76_07330 [Colwellia sp.]|nr:hypothetical protein [Colwellia sp.]
MVSQIKFYCVFLIILIVYSCPTEAAAITTLPQVSKWKLITNDGTHIINLTSERRYVSPDGHEKLSFRIEFGKGKPKGRLYVFGNIDKPNRNVSMKLIQKDKKVLICTGGLFSRSSRNMFMAGSCGDKANTSVWHAKTVTATTNKKRKLITTKVTLNSEKNYHYKALNTVNDKCTNSSLKEYAEIKMLISTGGVMKSQVGAQQFPQSHDSNPIEWAQLRYTKLEQILNVGLGNEGAEIINSAINDICDDALFCKIEKLIDSIDLWFKGMLNE